VDAFLQQTVVKGLLAGARVGMLMVFAPFFNSPVIASRIKAGLTLALTVLLYPAYAASRPVAGVADWVRVLLGEMAVGLMMALAITFVLEGVQFAGHLMGVQHGLSLESLIDPQTQADSQVLSLLYGSIALLIFLHLDVHLWVLRGLAKSYEYLPVGAASITMAGVLEMVRASKQIMFIGLQIAAPVLVATLLIDVTLGFLGKAAPQLPVTFMGISVKNLAGFSVMTMVIGYWPSFLEPRFRSALVTAQSLLHLAR